MRKIWENIAAPITRRLGTAFAVILVDAGVGVTEAEQIALGVMAAAAVGIDLCLSYLERRR